MKKKPKLIFIIAKKGRFEVWRHYVLTCHINKRLLDTYDTVEEAKEKYPNACVW